MARFFSMRIAPGIRLSASSRGLRAHVGPRAARLHVGGGRTGVSTGAGPFTWYEPVGGSSRRRTSSTPGSATSRTQPAVDPTAEVAKAFRTLQQLHKTAFIAAPVEKAAEPQLPKFGLLVATAEKQELRGVSLWDRLGRRTAKDRARVVAEGWARDLMTITANERTAREQAVEERHRKLASNEPATVGEVVSQAATRNRLPLTVRGVAGSTIRLTVQVPDAETIPDRKPARTPAGNPTLARLSKTEANEWHARLVAALAILAARLALGEAPSLERAAIVVRDPHGDALLAVTLSPLGASAAGAAADAWQGITEHGEELRYQVRGRVRELQPLDLAGDALYA